MKRGTRYSDEEIFALIIANRGYGLDRMVSKIYDEEMSKARRSKRYADTLQLLMDYKEYSGEDLYSVIQDPSMIEMVTRQEWNEATNNAPVPSGAGFSTSRVSKLDIKVGHGSNARGIPLPPVKFNWSEVVPLEDRVE